MEVTSRSSGYMVVDDFLPKEQFESVWNFFQSSAFVRIDMGPQVGNWLPEDGGGLRGPTVGYKVKWQALYPTGSAIDIVMKAIADNAEKFEPAIGKFGKDWDDFTAFATLYPAGTGLHWHRDAHVNTGSYIYYGHPEWNVEWGGELLLADESTHQIPIEYGVFFHKPIQVHGSKEPISTGTHLDNQDANELLSKTGLGNYVMPKPNRLVMVRCGTPHKVCKVAPSAGTHLRASIGGFFKKK